MQLKKPKVLMLGWEFPPVINGGLGIACHDLSSAMSEYADITMLLPKSSPGFKVKNINLIGLNHIDCETLKNISDEVDISKFQEVHEIETDLDPYYSEKADREGAVHPESHITSFMHNGKQLNVFNIDSLYGGNVIAKVHEFANIAAKLACKMDFDVIHAHDWMTLVAGVEIKNRTGKPLVAHIHSLEVDRSGPDSGGWVYETEKRGMEIADLLIPVSRFTADNIKQHYNIPSEKIFPVHNGIRPVTPFKGKKAFKEKTVLFIGRLTRQKGPEFFLDIAAKVLQVDPNVRFVMAGSGDSFQKVLENCSYRHLGNRFHLTGFLSLDKVRHLLSTADVYCMPSVSEPFGLSAVEAAQFGIPCVISKQSGVAEVMSGALKFDFWDIDKAADNIINVLENNALKEQVVNDAKENLAHICWKKSAKEVMNIYRENSLISINN